jgi:hypothetical protein
MLGRLWESPLNPDFRDMLCALYDESVEFLVVGAYSLAVHGLPRATGDLDIWIRNTPDNAVKAWKALIRFGAPTSKLTVQDLCDPDAVIQIGIAPRRIDLLTSITGVDFEEAWRDRVFTLVEGRNVSVIGRTQLILNKRSTGRPKDLADVAWLEQSTATGG